MAYTPNPWDPQNIEDSATHLSFLKKIEAAIVSAGGGGNVNSVTAADASVTVGGTGSAPTVATGSLDQIATAHPAGAAVSLNSQKVTNLGTPTANTDAATKAYADTSGPVTSTFGRTGAVVAQSGDYTAAQVTNAADKSSVSTQTFTSAVSAPAHPATGLSGATAATRYVGGTANGAPASGTFLVGDFVIDQTGVIWICTVAGTPGTWVRPAAQSSGVDVPLAVSTISPQNGGTIQGVVRVRGTTSGPVGTVQLNVDGDSWRPCNRRSNTWSVSLNTNAYASGSHTINVRSLDVNSVVVATTSTTISFAAAQTIIPGVQLFKLNDTGYTNSTNKNKYSVFVVGQPNDLTAGIANDSAMNNTRHLLWCHAINVLLNELGGMGVSGAEIDQNGWWVYDGGGAKIGYGDGSFMVDVGNVNYQNRLIDRWLNPVNQLGPGVGIFSQFPNAAGVLMDNIFDYSYVTMSPQYPNNRSYRDAVRSLVRNFGSALKAAGYYFGGNISTGSGDLGAYNIQNYDGTEYDWWMKEIAPYFDGMAQEFYMRFDKLYPPRVKGTGLYQAFDTMVQIHTDMQTIGVDYMPWIKYTTSGGSTPASGEVAVLTYQKGAFLLDAELRGGSVFGAAADDYGTTGDPWDASWTADIGLPTGAKTNPQTGLWKRLFTKGATNNVVLVNTNSTDVWTLTITGTPTAGTFTLTVDGQTTSALAFNCTSAQVQAAIAALGGVGAGNIFVTGAVMPGGTHTITFGSAKPGSHTITFTNSLSGGSSPTPVLVHTTTGAGALTQDTHVVNPMSAYIGVL